MKINNCNSVSYYISPGPDANPLEGEGVGAIAYSEPHLLFRIIYSHNSMNRKQNVSKQTEIYETFQKLYPWVSQNPRGGKNTK